MGRFRGLGSGDVDAGAWIFETNTTKHIYFGLGFHAGLLEGASKSFWWPVDGPAAVSVAKQSVAGATGGGPAVLAEIGAGPPPTPARHTLATDRGQAVDRPPRRFSGP